MNLLRTITLVLVLVISNAYGQLHNVKSGIYLTANDFQNKKLLEEEACKKDHEEFKKHDFFKRDSFDVIYKGKKTSFLKRNIFAYRDCSNKTWRFYDNKEYEMVEQRAIYIYKLSKIVLNGITVEKDPVYYFSPGLKGEIRELTNGNLKTVFANNKEFCKLVDADLKSEIPDQATHAYDAEHKMYRVNYLYLLSKKK